ncbi:MAG: PGF-pre-PGF domain-containing protein, partial [Candidatus Aenigmarchaeota archaeon]|nr:PGF-pre-PGF domain-containing protein [Candidatus Aenigmarchaeota archaeon]
SCTLTSSNGWSYVYGNPTTLTCSCTGDGTTHLYFNGVLHDDYNATSVVFAANPSGHSVICNTTEGTNYASDSTSNSLVISKVYPDVSLSGSNVTYPEHVNVTVTESNSGDSDCTYILKRNNSQIGLDTGVAPDGDTSQLAAGDYHYEFFSEGCQNYTGFGRELYITVFKGEIPVNLFFNNGTEYQNQNMTITYGTQSNITATSSAGTVFIYRDGVEITNGTSPQSEIATLGAGTYAYKVNATGNANYSDNSTGLTYYLIVNKATPSLSLSGTWNIYYGTATDITASESNSGDGDCNYRLYRDSTLVGSGSSVSDTSTLDIGTYVYNYSTSGCTNYTSGEVTNTLTVSQMPSGGGTPPELPPSNTQIWVKMTPGAAHIMKITNEEIGLKEMQITVNNEANNVKITVKKLEGKPASVTHEISGKVYRYIEVTKQNLKDENIESAKIKFEVSKSWLSENGYDPDSVILERYTENGWMKLNTLRVGETIDSYIYEAETPGFSVFAIAATTPPPTEITTTTTTVPTTTTTTIQPVQPTPPTEKPIQIDYKLIGVIILLVIMIVFLLLSLKK